MKGARRSTAGSRSHGRAGNSTEVRMTLKQQKYKDREGRLKKSRKWYADFYDHRGIRHALPLLADRKNAQEAGRAVEHLIGIRASGAMLPPELHRFIENTTPAIRQKLAAWGIID